MRGCVRHLIVFAGYGPCLAAMLALHKSGLLAEDTPAKVTAAAACGCCSSAGRQASRPPDPCPCTRRCRVPQETRLNWCIRGRRTACGPTCTPRMLGWASGSGTHQRFAAAAPQLQQIMTAEVHQHRLPTPRTCHEAQACSPPPGCTCMATCTARLGWTCGASSYSPVPSWRRQPCLTSCLGMRWQD